MSAEQNPKPGKSSNITGKLTPSQREEIVTRYARGEASQSALAKEYGVSQAAISSLVHKEKIRSKKAAIQKALSAEDLPLVDMSVITGRDPMVRRTIPARPTREISSAVFQAILERIAGGASISAACHLEKVSPHTFRQLIGKWEDLRQRVEEARAIFVDNLRVLTLEAATEGKGHAGTLLKMLERLDQDFAPPVHQVHSTSTTTSTVNHNHTHAVAIWDAPGTPTHRIARADLIAIASGQPAAGQAPKALNPPSAVNIDKLSSSELDPVPGDVVEAQVVTEPESE